MSAEIHVGDVGTSFRATVYDQDGAIVDLSTFTSLILKVMKPNRKTENFTATLYTDGTDGIMEYVTSSANDLSQSGIWKMQGIVTLSGGGNHYSDIVEFRVEPNL